MSSGEHPLRRVTKRTAALLNQQGLESLHEYRRLLSDAILRTVLFFGALALIAGTHSAYDSYKTSHNLILLIILLGSYYGVYAAMAVVLFSKRSTHRLKRLTIVSAFYGIGVLLLLESGLFGEGRLFLFNFTLLVAMLSTLPAAIGAAILSTMTVMLIGLVKVYGGKILFGVFVQAPQDTVTSWTTATAVYALLTSAVVVSLVHLMRALAHSLTEKSESERRYLQAQKMEAVGQLAGGLAHDFNNLLAPILLNAEILAEGFATDDPRRTQCEQVQEAATKAARIARRLLTFSQGQSPEREMVDLNSLTQGFAAMAGSVLGSGIKLDLGLEPDLPAISADPGQLEQVLMNLVVNGRDAMQPGGGTLSIETGRQHLDSDTVNRYMGKAHPGPHARLTVRDTGTGIEQGNLDRIFEPFFSTKPTDKGTGLGLAAVFGIVQQHQGCLSTTSVVGQGTRFDVFLPMKADGSQTNRT